MSSITTKYPGFTLLLDKLSKRIDLDSGMSKESQAELQEAKEMLAETKQYYFQQLLLYTELKELLLEHNYGLKDDKYEHDDQEREPFRVLFDTMSSAEAKQCLNITMKAKADQDEQLFGLTREDLEMDAAEKKLVQQNLQQICIPLLEKRLRTKSLQLLKFWNPNNKDSEGLAIAKANQLPTTLANEKKSLAESKKSLPELKRRYQTTFQDKYQEILNSLKELEENIEEYQQKPNAETTPVTVDWLAAKCDYMLGKITVMKNHLHAETYTSETVEALQKVRYHLDQEIRQTQTELDKTKKALLIYESVGDTFKNLLHEHTELTREIDTKKWALTELQKSSK